MATRTAKRKTYGELERQALRIASANRQTNRARADRALSILNRYTRNAYNRDNTFKGRIDRLGQAFREGSTATIRVQREVNSTSLKRSDYMGLANG